MGISEKIRGGVEVVEPFQDTGVGVQAPWNHPGSLGDRLADTKPTVYPPPGGDAWELLSFQELDASGPILQPCVLGCIVSLSPKFIC